MSFEWFGDLAESFADAQTRHALSVHFPIVLSVLAVVALIACLFSTRVWPRAATLFLLLALVASAFFAKRTGEDAEGTVEGLLSSQGEAVLEEHEELGEKIWLFAAATTLLCVLSWRGRGVARAATASLAAAAGLFTASWAAFTAHHGGELVYTHGAAASEPAWTPPAPDPTQPPAADPRVEHFRTRILPVLTSTCWRCHNPTRAERSGGLDQTTAASFLRGGNSGPPFLPGRPAESLLMRSLRYDDEELQMPPADKLPDETIADFERWIADGAVWDVPPQAEAEKSSN
jgi:uncharacterized membrane protein